MVKRIMAENKAAAMDQRKYQMRRNGLVAKYEAVRDGFCGKFSETETLDISEIDDEIKWKETDDATDKAAKAIAAAIMGVPIVLAKAIKGANDTVENIRATVERADLWKHQYELLVCEYLLNGFKRFMHKSG